MVLDIVPDLVFEMTVTDAVPGQRYAFETEIIPPVGKLYSSHETYAVEPAGEGACRLSLTMSAWFLGGMSNKALAREVMVMATSCENGLQKLKVQAEQGPEAVHAIEAMQFG